MKKEMSLKEMIKKAKEQQKRKKPKKPKKQKPKKEPVPLTPEERKLMDKFLSRLQKFAKKNNLTVEETGWAIAKIEWMALNNNKCGCRPDERKCPCKQSLEETKNGKLCTCSVLKG